LSYLQPFTGEKDTFWPNLKEGQKCRKTGANIANWQLATGNGQPAKELPAESGGPVSGVRNCKAFGFGLMRQAFGWSALNSGTCNLEPET
jgi:hypothetical protein